jgi:hypothetical protein
MRKILPIVVLAALVSSAMLSAHEVFRIVGTIVKFEKWRLDVKTADGEMFLIQLQEYTPIQRDKKRVTSKELKAGVGVVVEVVGDTPYDADRYVASVTAVPSSTVARKK